MQQNSSEFSCYLENAPVSEKASKTPSISLSYSFVENGSSGHSKNRRMVYSRSKNKQNGTPLLIP